MREVTLGDCVAGRRVAGDPLMVSDHFGDDEVEELLREGRVQFRVLREAAQAGDLFGFAVGVGRGQFVVRLEMADLLGALEALGEHVDNGSVDVVDAFAEPVQFRAYGLVGVAGGHGRRA